MPVVVCVGRRERGFVVENRVDWRLSDVYVGHSYCWCGADGWRFRQRYEQQSRVDAWRRGHRMSPDVRAAHVHFLTVFCLQRLPVMLLLGETDECRDIVFEMVIRVAPPADGAAQVTTTGTARSRFALDNSIGELDKQEVVLRIVSPQIDAVAVTTPATGDSGDTTRYCVTLTNSGEACARDMQTIGLLVVLLLLLLSVTRCV
jgi:hypothetical protein